MLPNSAKERQFTPVSKERLEDMKPARRKPRKLGQRRRVAKLPPLTSYSPKRQISLMKRVDQKRRAEAERGGQADESLKRDRLHTKGTKRAYVVEQNRRGREGRGLRRRPVAAATAAPHCAVGGRDCGHIGPSALELDALLRRPSFELHIALAASTQRARQTTPAAVPPRGKQRLSNYDGQPLLGGEEDDGLIDLDKIMRDKSE